VAGPAFLGDKLRYGLLWLLALFFLLAFWAISVVFLFLNLVVAWHRLWRWIGVWNLVMFRFIMRMRNLYDTSHLLANKPEPPQTVPWKSRYQSTRSADGTFNDLGDPRMGSAGMPLGRNFRPDGLKVESLADPDPREVSRKLLTRDKFRPATSLNLLAAAWIQFEVHDWFSHMRSGKYVTHKTPKGDTFSIRPTFKAEMDPDAPAAEKHLPVYLNTETHWWDGSQLYGSNQDRQDKLRDKDASGKRATLTVEKFKQEWRLPKSDDSHFPGVDLSGFNQNWWVGLSLLHTLFALEHNAICDRLRKAYPGWDEERLFNTARLINTALMAKIHTVEWTPAILGHPTLLIGMRANWWGILTERLNRALGRIRLIRGIQEEITGVPGSEKDHFAAPYAMTEEFVSVYRLHPLIPDSYRFYSVETDTVLDERDFDHVQANETRPCLENIGFANAFYSFGVTHPGAITLHNFPRALQNFILIKDVVPDQQKPIENEKLDLAMVDIYRDRERAVPRYNAFRRRLLKFPVLSYRHLVGVPLLFPSLSKLTPREREERQKWVKELQDIYGKRLWLPRWINKKWKPLDLMVGLFAEAPPTGFGFSDTAFRIFVLMAPRRLKSDRFFTDDFKPEVYTDIGIQWINENGLRSVLQRHYPELTGPLADVQNPFAPWDRVGRPPVEPARHDPFSFSLIPVLGGGLLGAVSGIVANLWTLWPSSSSTLRDAVMLPFDALWSWDTLGGAVIGAGIGALCTEVLYVWDFLFATRRIKDAQGSPAAIVLPVTVVGGFLGAAFAICQATATRYPTDQFSVQTLKLIWSEFRQWVGIWNCHVDMTVQAALQGFARPEATLGAAVAGAAALAAVATFKFSKGILQGEWTAALRVLGRNIGRALIGAATAGFAGWMLGALFELVNALVDNVNIAEAAGSRLALWIAIGFAVLAVVDRGTSAFIPGALIGWIVGALLMLPALYVQGHAPEKLVEGISQIYTVFASDRAFWGATLFAFLGAVFGLYNTRYRWVLRRGFWNFVAFIKFSRNKPLRIEVPNNEREDREHGQEIAAMPLAKDFPAIQADNITVGNRIPADERVWRRTQYRMKAIVFPLTRRLARWLGPMQPDLCPKQIHRNPQKALEQAYHGRRRRLYDPPILPPEFEGSPDLGSLAVRGPYAGYLKRLNDQEFEWDLWELQKYQPYKGLYRLGVRVLFKVDNGRLKESQITYSTIDKEDPHPNELTHSDPGKSDWEFAKSFALCAVSNHMSLVRHWNWVHLTPTAHLAIATRKCLPDDHPLKRVLWPHVFGTMQSNYFGTMAQMDKGGDFETIFSYPYDEMCKLFNDTHKGYDFTITDPVKDAEERGIWNRITYPVKDAIERNKRYRGFETPTQDNLERLFNVILEHATEYVEIYYPKDPQNPDEPLKAIVNDSKQTEAVRKQVDDVLKWLTELNHLIPRRRMPQGEGTGLKPDTITRGDLARLLARFIYLVTAHHEMVGALLWNYQLCTHRQPVRMYKNGQREPLDVYQRLVNYNYLLNVKRTMLMDDWSYLGIDDRGRQAFGRFKQALEDLDQKMRNEAPWAVWRLYPGELEAHINA
jgi:hypothetical protein